MAATATEPRTEAKPAGRVTKWNVMIRHSPFLLKNADVEANSIDEAKEKFLALCKEKTERVARGEMGQAALHNGGERNPKEAARVRQTFTDGMNRQHEFVWIIRPAAEVKAQRDSIKEQRGAAEERFTKLLDRLSTVVAAQPAGVKA